MSKYIDRVLEECRQKNAGEPEFLQTVEEVLTSWPRDRRPSRV